MQKQSLELITNDILFSWDEELGVPSSILSSLNAYFDFLTEFDKFLVMASGYEGELQLVLDSLEDRGLRFNLTYNMLVSGQLSLGQQELGNELKSWLIQMHHELLTILLDLSDQDNLDSLLFRAEDLATYYNLKGNLYFSLSPSKRVRARLEKLFGELSEILKHMSGKVTMEIVKS